MRTRLFTGAVFLGAALVLGCGVGVDSKSTDSPPAAAPQTTAAASPKAPAGPQSTFGEGTHEVGVDIVPGKYTTTVPAGSYGCYWARLKGLGGELADIIANGNAKAGAKVVVTVAPTDKGFESKSCGTWVKS